MKNSTRIALIYVGFFLLVISIVISLYGLINSPSVPLQNNPYGYRFDGIFLGLVLITLAIMFAFYFKVEEISYGKKPQ